MIHSAGNLKRGDQRPLQHFRVFLLHALVPLAASAAGAGSTLEKKTEVTVFRPPVPSGPSRSGECWTESIAVSRSGAWRCMVGNEIYDPCFSSAGLIDAVICDANPAKGSAGFILKLTKPSAQAVFPRADLSAAMACEACR
jgi:hypothetical protein